MPFDLAAALPLLLPRAVAWAEATEAEALDAGTALSPNGIALARAVGVDHPELVRVALVDSLPLPDDPELSEAAIQTGLLGPGMVGLTLGYAVYLCHDTPRLLSHECRHVHQYEVAGSIASFLRAYFQQIVEFGYEHAPLEVDARNNERDAP